MKEIQMLDNIFDAEKFMINKPYHDKIQWIKTIKNTDLMVYTDNTLQAVLNTRYKYNVAWIVESPAFTPHAYKWIKINYDKFDVIFTFDKELLSISDKFILNNIGECWIPQKDQKIWEKKKNISIIASGKNFLPGHKLRHEVIRNFKNIDVFGRGYKEIKYKTEGLKDYKFSITIENIKMDYYFTEKLIDVFMTGTIPIYYGCPSVGDFFDIRGMLIFNNMYELNNIMNNLTDEKYESMKKYIDINFEKAKKYRFAEDNIYDILKNKKII